MSTLKDQLKQRGIDFDLVNSPFYGTADRAVMVEVEDSNGDAWVLPWNHFLCSRHDPSSEDAPLLLTFVAHQIKVWGVNLDGVTAAIAKQRLAWLRAAPGRYLKSASEKEPAIERIKVIPLREPILTE